MPNCSQTSTESSLDKSPSSTSSEARLQEEAPVKRSRRQRKNMRKKELAATQKKTNSGSNTTKPKSGPRPFVIREFTPINYH